MRPNKLFFAGLILVSTILLGGCGSNPAVSDKPINYGPYPKDYETIVKSYLEGTLFDPYSVKYIYVTKPFEAYTREAPIFGGSPVVYGWYSRVCFNAKNRMGGYVGKTCYNLLIKNDSVVHKFTPNPWHSEQWYM
jgi:hypothetical protein